MGVNDGIPYFLTFQSVDDWNNDIDSDKYQTAGATAPPTIGSTVRIKAVRGDIKSGKHYEGIVVALYYDYCVHHAPRVNVVLSDITEC